MSKQTPANLKASQKYKRTEKGKLAKVRDESSLKGKVRALKYFHSKKGKAKYYKRVFGIDYEDYESIMQIAKGRCIICKENNKKRVLCIDHDHITGKFRGVLCDNCNKGIGFFKDNPLLLKNAITYLELHQSNEEIIIPIFN